MLHSSDYRSEITRLQVVVSTTHAVALENMSTSRQLHVTTSTCHVTSRTNNNDIAWSPSESERLPKNELKVILVLIS